MKKRLFCASLATVKFKTVAPVVPRDDVDVAAWCHRLQRRMRLVFFPVAVHLMRERGEISAECAIELMEGYRLAMDKRKGVT